MVSSKFLLKPSIINSQPAFVPSTSLLSSCPLETFVYCVNTIGALPEIDQGFPVDHLQDQKTASLDRINRRLTTFQRHLSYDTASRDG